MKITQPTGFVTNTAPLIEWEAVEGVTEYALSITNNVTGEDVLNTVVDGDASYQLASPLPLGTYAIQVVGGDSITIEVFIVTDTIAQYTIIGREGDVNYTNYKSYQMAIRQQAKSLGSIANSIIQTNQAIADLLSVSNDASLTQFHADTIKQTPGFATDFTQVLSLCSQIKTLIEVIAKRDPQF